MVWGRSLLDAFLDDSKGEFATVRDIYSSFDAYQTHVCLLADRASLGRLTQVLDKFPYEDGREEDEFASTLILPPIIDWDAASGRGELPCETAEEASTCKVIHASSSHNSAWLEENAARIAKAGSPFSARELADNLLDLLRRNPPTLQEDVFNLLGWEEVGFIEQLLAGRETILKTIAAPSRKDANGPVLRAKVSVKGETLRRHFATEWEIATAEAEQLEQLKQLQLSTPQKPVEYPFVFGGKREVTFGAKLSLPVGTEHVDSPTCEQFTIPYQTRTRTKQPAVALVNVADMEHLARLAFAGYTRLNLMQSVVYETAYFTNENMLVSAPTGAGKTDVAMLAILKAIRDNLLGSPNDARPSIARDAFKIVYVAPMKALATEIVGKFSKRLASLGMRVREYTGDMQLTRREIQETQVIVSTPEKWDVVTRKAQGDVDLVRLVTLLIIDEVHLLHDSRGPVLESIVARTLREVEVSQRMIRIVGLSATLPNYLDVAAFLRVNPHVGMFYFDDSFRPVPLTQQFVGVKGKQMGAVATAMNAVCFEKMAGYVRNDHQVMIFVHSRADTTKTARGMIRIAHEEKISFVPATTSREYQRATLEVNTSRNKDVRELFAKGFGVHHAGMIRSDRLLVERMFMDGHIRVLVCTATLAWGVNLPAHAVIIKGTQVYDADKGEFASLGILDVLQIFGRAGRPQFETHGEAIILTTHDKLHHYLNAIMCQTPIESQFIKMLPDNLNAEVALGTVSNKQEAVAWLGYTYLTIRMRRNPLAYGITAQQLALDPKLHGKMNDIIVDVATRLSSCGMINFDCPEREGFMRIRQVGRLASLFYLSYETVALFGKLMNPRMTEDDILAMICACSEFETIKVREDELEELEGLGDTSVMTVRGDLTSTPAKVSLLMQAWISRFEPQAFSLQSDLNTIRQNAGRVLRAAFEIVRSQEWAQCSLRVLRLCVAFERRVWPLEHPLAGFEQIPRQVLACLHARGIKDMQTLLEDFDMTELAMACGQGHKLGPLLRRCVLQFPRIRLDVSCHPVLPSVLKLKVDFVVDFLWDDATHGGVDHWWLWVEDEDHVFMKHCETISTTKSQVGVARNVEFYVAIDPKCPPSQLYVRAVSNRWPQASEIVSLPLRFYSSLLLGDQTNAPSQHTDLLPLAPLPISALHDPLLESLYAERFLCFNAIQTQTFHTLYHQQHSVLVGAPTGSGKTILAELAMWGALRSFPAKKIVYIAPLKALVKERLADWKTRLESKLGISVVELTGDMTPDNAILTRATLILSTPEKWDGISRNWQHRTFVADVALVILDEIHLLGGERGHVLEMIVSRMRTVAGSTVRLVGLSTAMANAGDLSAWLNVAQDARGLFNFRPSVRPVPLQVFLEGYPDQHYCPRMSSMNKPIYTHILTLSPDRPVLIFVSSRRQTRLTAQALISLCVNDDQPRRFLFARMDDPVEGETKLAALLERIIDPVFKHTLSFGIAMHHAGMPESDRQIAEEAFVLRLAQVLVATSTVAWGVNFPAHLVIVKGTEFYDAQTGGYRDQPVTDILQMIGRAGRPQFDTSAKAVILAQDSKKYFYKKFLYEPFPIESCLHRHLADHVNAEVAGGVIKTTDDAVSLLKTTYLGLRLARNPLYYGAEGGDPVLVSAFLMTLVEDALRELVLSGCIHHHHPQAVEPTVVGRIAAKFYLSHRTMRHFIDMLNPQISSLTPSIPAENGVNQLLRAVAFASEFDAFPLRHNEDNEMRDFVAQHRSLIADPLLKTVAPLDYTRPHAKVYVLLRAHLLRIPLPVLDFETDAKLALEQAARILAGLVELAARQFWLGVLVDAVTLGQLVRQKCWLDASLTTLPFITTQKAAALASKFPHLCDMLHADAGSVMRALKMRSVGVSDSEANAITAVLKYDLPKVAATHELARKSIHLFRLTVTLKDARRSTRGDDSWWRVFVGDESSGTLLCSPVSVAARRLDRRFVVTLEFECRAGEAVLFVVSDTFYGLDQMHRIPLAQR